MSIALSSGSDNPNRRPINFQFVAACVSFSFSAQSFSPDPCVNEEVTSTCSGVLSRVVDLRRLFASAAGVDCCLVAGICNDAWSLVDVGSDCGGVVVCGVTENDDCDLVETGVLAADSDCIEDGVSTNESDLVDVGSDCGGVTEILSTNGDRTGVSIDFDLVETGVLAADSDCIEDGVSTNESDLVEVGVLGIDPVVEYVMFVSPILLSLFSITLRIPITL